MKSSFGPLAGLVVSLMPATLLAQQAPPAPAGTPTTDPSPKGDAPTADHSTPTQLQFRSADGKPLPPEIVRQLQEQFKNGVPAAGTVLRLPARKDDKAPAPLAAPTAGDQPSVSGDPAQAAPQAPKKREFRRADGKPLPPEILRQLE